MAYVGSRHKPEIIRVEEIAIAKGINGVTRYWLTLQRPLKIWCIRYRDRHTQVTSLPLDQPIK